MKKHTATATTATPAADWRLYAAAAGAGLAAVTHADAAIIYVDPTVKPQAASSGAQNATFHIDGFQVNLRAFVTSNRNPQEGINGAPAFFRQFDTVVGSNVVKNYAAGAAIGGGSAGAASLLRARFTGSQSGVVTGTLRRGQFLTNQAGFAGFKLPNGDLGWVQLEISSNNAAFPNEVTAIDWAYNDVPGMAITARQVPEPGTDKALALLALGSAGVLAWRKRRQAAAAQP